MLSTQINIHTHLTSPNSEWSFVVESVRVSVCVSGYMCMEGWTYWTKLLATSVGPVTACWNTQCSRTLLTIYSLLGQRERKRERASTFKLQFQIYCWRQAIRWYRDTVHCMSACTLPAHYGHVIGIGYTQKSNYRRLSKFACHISKGWRTGHSMYWRKCSLSPHLTLFSTFARTSLYTACCVWSCVDI